ncbi:unnamed protein product, partial [Mesorhabditis belari]|uniref:Uncharacterized protein n=1 Tax=Mesorhabditis belari TaxID=2138241 RepID=A0AAF3FE81_9BILA
MIKREDILKNLQRDRDAEKEMEKLRASGVMNSIQLEQEEQEHAKKHEKAISFTDLSKQILNDFETTKYEMGSVLGSNSDYHAIIEEGDISRLFGELNAFELSLMGSSSVPLASFHKKAVNDLAFDDDVLGPQITLDDCLAWFSRAGGCKIHDLLPPAEIFPNAEKYSKKLEQYGLPIISERKEVEKTIILQMTRVLEFIRKMCLSSLSIEHIAMLLFVLLRISIDRLAEYRIRTGIFHVLTKIFNCEAARQRKIIAEFSAISLHLCEDMVTLQSAIENLQYVVCGCTGILPVLTSLLVSKTENDSLAVGDLSSRPKATYLREHLRVVKRIIPQIAEVLSIREAYAIFCMLDNSICSCVVKELQPDVLDRLIQAIKEGGQAIKAANDGSLEETVMKGLIEIRVAAMINKIRFERPQ